MTPPGRLEYLAIHQVIPNQYMTSSLSDDALTAAQNIAAALQREPQLTSNSSLAEGHAGLAVFHAYLAQATADEAQEATARLHLERALERLDDRGVGLFAGATGVAWAAQHLDQRVVDLDPDLLGALDRSLATFLETVPDSWDYDLIDGIVGLGVYFLERLPSPLASGALVRIVEWLARTVGADEQCRGWYTPPDRLPAWQRAVAPSGYYNLGVAHGASGVLGLLGSIWEAGIARETIFPLLQASMTWIWSQRLPVSASADVRFPSWVAVRADCHPSSPAAWCYGDLGMSLPLLRAARITGNATWQAEVIGMAMRAAEHSHDSAMVRDASLCHGSAGNGQLFHRLYLETEREEFRRAASYWFTHTLSIHQPAQGIAGFLTCRHDAGVFSWVKDPGLLMGVAGVGLGLLTASGRVEPNWDRVLLLS